MKSRIFWNIFQAKNELEEKVETLSQTTFMEDRMS